MENTAPIFILDADAIIATLNEDDTNHVLAMKINTRLTEMQANILIPVTVIMETLTALKRVVNRSDLAKDLVEKLNKGDFPTLAVNTDTMYEALVFFDPLGSKQDTFFDAVIAAFAKKNVAKAIFSFDQGYKKKGFVLIADYLKLSK